MATTLTGNAVFWVDSRPSDLVVAVTSDQPLADVTTTTVTLAGPDGVDIPGVVGSLDLVHHVPVQRLREVHGHRDP